MFFKHFADKNQLPGFYISGTLIKNGLIIGSSAIKLSTCEKLSGVENDRKRNFDEHVKDLCKKRK